MTATAPSTYVPCVARLPSGRSCPGRSHGPAPDGRGCCPMHGGASQPRGPVKPRVKQPKRLHKP